MERQVAFECKTTKERSAASSSPHSLKILQAAQLRFGFHRHLTRMPGRISGKPADSRGKKKKHFTKFLQVVFFGHAESGVQMEEENFTE